MSEYTPTTEEIQEMVGFPWLLDRKNARERLGKFNRWLEAHDREVGIRTLNALMAASAETGERDIHILAKGAIQFLESETKQGAGA